MKRKRMRTESCKLRVRVEVEDTSQYMYDSPQTMSVISIKLTFLKIEGLSS